MSVGKCQKIVSQLESMLPDAQLIYSGNKNSINRMKKDLATLRRLIREAQQELSEGASDSSIQIGQLAIPSISSLLEPNNSIPRMVSPGYGYTSPLAPGYVNVRPMYSYPPNQDFMYNDSKKRTQPASPLSSSPQPIKKTKPDDPIVLN